MKHIKPVSTLWKNVETTNAARFQQFPGKNTRELTTCSTGIEGASGQEGNNFSICCGIGEFLLDFQ